MTRDAKETLIAKNHADAGLGPSAGFSSSDAEASPELDFPEPIKCSHVADAAVGSICDSGTFRREVLANAAMAASPAVH
jgi:hypothetical protein